MTGNVVNNQAEFGVETLESYQKHGYGKLLSLTLIQECLQQNLTPHWYCFANNRGSENLVSHLPMILHAETELSVFELTE